MNEVKKIKGETKIPSLKPGQPLPDEYKKLFAFGEYTDEMMEKEEQAVTKSFNEIFKGDGVLTVYVPELNCNIKFKPLTVTDLIECDSIRDDLKRGDEMLFRQWSAGDQTITREDFNRLVAWKKNAVIFAIGRKTPFLALNQPEESPQEATSGGESKKS